MTCLAESEAAGQAMILRIREFIARGCRDWWDTDMDEFFELSGDTALELGSPIAALGSIEARCYYRIGWEREDIAGRSGNWRAVSARIQLFAQFHAGLPATDVTDRLDADGRQWLIEYVCDRAERLRAERERNEEAAERYAASLE